MFQRSCYASLPSLRGTGFWTLGVRSCSTQSLDTGSEISCEQHAGFDADDWKEAKNGLLAGHGTESFGSDAECWALSIPETCCLNRCSIPANSMSGRRVVGWGLRIGLRQLPKSHCALQFDS